MKKTLKSAGAVFAAIVFAVGLLPAQAFAADSETVLTSIYHESAVASVDVTGKTSAVLTVPYAYAGDSVNLPSGLNIYFGSGYTSAVASFVDPIAYIGSGTDAGEPVTMTVTYQKTGDEAFYTSDYSISVARAAYVAPTFSGTISKSVSLPDALTFSESDFTDKYTKNNGTELNSVVISGSNPTFGALYLNGSEYTLGDKISLTDITGGKFTFVATAAGTVSYIVDAYDDNGLAGSAVLSVTVKEKVVSISDLSYTNYEDTAVTFSASSFNTVYYNATAIALSYVKFTLPSSTYGTLYYNYSSASSYDSLVSASKEYYVSASPYLSKVTFVPKTDYTGTVTLTYTGYDAGGTGYTGSVKLIYKDDGSADTITYTTDEDEEITFDTSDFNDVCEDATDETLYYVKFTLPSSTYGKLYYNYTSSSSYDSAVSSSTKYYRSASSYLSKVTFVPKTGYTGTVTISYTGYNTDGDSFTGKVKITVGDDDDADTITYTTDEDEEITFDTSDFNDVCEDATDETLYYVKFTLPSSTYGKLYYNYTSSSSYDSAVSASTKYYRSASSYLSKVTFVPKTGYTGTVTISYTGYNTDGDSYTGSVKITVSEGSSSEYFTDVTNSLSWAMDEIDYLYEEGVISGTSSTLYSPNSSITRGDFILMLYRAFKLTSSSATSNFTDVKTGSYYYAAIAAAKALGIAKGSDGEFRPGQPLTRQDAMVLIMRTLTVSDVSLTSGKESDLTAFSDKSSLSAYAVTSAATLIRAKVIEGSNAKLNPLGYLTRAQMAVIVYRVLDL